jgi:hypothetical protein
VIVVSATEVHHEPRCHKQLVEGDQSGHHTHVASEAEDTPKTGHNLREWMTPWKLVAGDKFQNTEGVGGFQICTQRYPIIRNLISVGDQTNRN